MDDVTNQVIQHLTGRTLYQGDHPDFKSALEYGVKIGVDFAGANLRDQDLSRVSLVGGKFDGANFDGCKLVGTNLQNANLKNSSMVFVNMRNAYTEGMSMVGATATHWRT